MNRLALFASTRMAVTIRRCYYHLDVSGLIDETEVGYTIVVDLMNEMLDAEIIDPDLGGRSVARAAERATRGRNRLVARKTPT